MDFLANHYRMFAIIDEVFDMRNDPDQLQVDETVMQKLAAIHPATMGEVADENGPLIWSLMIPTTAAVMQKFLAGEIAENQLLEQTRPGEKYDCIYLCSVSTLPEKRSKGETKKLCLQQINAIRKDHAITSLYVWAFSKEGEQLADTLGKMSGLPVYKK
ncbi:MAG: hypothetical protein HYZ14_07680 [Bacteroidetes bacterium]|nr:hypothetical protein [Bacteroidota bacterium]